MRRFRKATKEIRLSCDTRLRMSVWRACVPIMTQVVLLVAVWTYNIARSCIVSWNVANATCFMGEQCQSYGEIGAFAPAEHSQSDLGFHCPHLFNDFQQVGLQIPVV